MKITHYLYNSFIVEWEDKKIAFDPGCLFFYFLRTTSLIPTSEWSSITHVFVTHGDPDHYWHVDRVAAASGAEIILNRSMVREHDGKKLVLGPRSKGLTFDTPLDNLHTLEPGDSIQVDGMNVTGIETTHGPLLIKVGPFSRMETPGPEERIGWGAIGFQIELGGKKLVNLGDTLLLADEWRSISEPDVLMIPIGGKEAHNTMDVNDALKAIEMIRPKWVIPTHYNMPALFKRKYGPADDALFQRGVESMGSHCQILGRGDSIDL